MLIERASSEDLADILALQKLAFITEADIYGDFSIPPLTQTEASLREEFAVSLVFKAVEDGRIIGSVRGRDVDGTRYVGRLAVHPDHRRKGAALALMQAMHAAPPPPRRFEIFTGDKSAGPMALYRRLGYREFRRKPMNDAVTLVFMEKPGPSPAP